MHRSIFGIPTRNQRSKLRELQTALELQIAPSNHGMILEDGTNSPSRFSPVLGTKSDDPGAATYLMYHYCNRKGTEELHVTSVVRHMTSPYSFRIRGSTALSVPFHMQVSICLMHDREYILQFELPNATMSVAKRFGHPPAYESQQLGDKGPDDGDIYSECP